MTLLSERIARFEARTPSPLTRCALVGAALLLLCAVLALVWTIPVPGTLFQPGAFAGALMAALAAWCFRQSRPVGIALALLLAGIGLGCWGIATCWGMGSLRLAGLVLLPLAFAGLLLAVRGDARRALHDLLAAPAWALTRVCRRLGIPA